MPPRLDAFARYPRAFPFAATCIVVAGAVGIQWAVTRAAVPALWLYVIPIVCGTALGLLAALSWPRARPQTHADRPSLYVAAILGTLLCATLATLAALGHGYWKPPAFYVLYAAAAVLLLIQPFLVPPRSGVLGASLAQGAALVAMYSLLTHGATVGGAGADAVFHRHMATALAASGGHHAITPPYDAFAAYHDVVAWLIQLGLSPRDAIAADAGVIAALFLVAGALLASRAFGLRAGAVACALLAASPDLLSTAASVSPSKTGVVAMLAAGFAFLLGGAAAAILATFFVVVAALHHPSVGASALAIACGSAAILYGLNAPRWMPRVASALGFEPRNGLVVARKQRLIVLAATGVLAVAAALVFLLAAPRLYMLATNALHYRGDQSGAIGAVRAAFSAKLLGETLLLDLATAAVTFPGVYALTRSFLSPATRGAFVIACGFASIAAIVGFIVGSGRFLLGAERFLITFNVILTLAASYAIALFVTSGGDPRVRLATLAIVASLVFVVSASSYRVDGSDWLSPDVPKQTDYMRVEASAAVVALRPHLTERDVVAADLYMAFYTTNFPSHSDETFWKDPIDRANFTSLNESMQPPGRILIMSREGTARYHDTALWEATFARSNIAYDNGLVRAGVA